MIPLRRALLWILLSVVVTLSAAALLGIYTHSVRESRRQDEAYTIISIVQTGPEKECLKTTYLAEVLGLSIDKPTNLHALSVKEAKRKLLNCSQIKEAEVRKNFPNTICIDYTLREPLAILLDYSNTAIDQEQILFSFHPFYRPKKLPEIYLGIRDEGNEVWGKKIAGEEIVLAFKILDHLTEHYVSAKNYLRRIDVSNAFSSSYGKREIVLGIEEVHETITQGKSILYRLSSLLRLDPDNFEEAFAHYLLLKDYVMRQNLEQTKDPSTSIVELPLQIVDLRIPQLAFLKTN